MEYLFSKCQHHEDGSCTIPAWAVSRWSRQMKTEYLDSPEAEKESDREEARKIINLIKFINKEEDSC